MLQQAQDQLLSNALNQLKSGKDPKVVLEYFGHTLTNRFMHEPTVCLRQAGFQGDETMLAFTRDLFELNYEIIDKE